MLHTYVVIERIPSLFSLTDLSLEEKAVENAVVKENVVSFVVLGTRKYSSCIDDSSEAQAHRVLYDTFTF